MGALNRQDGAIDNRLVARLAESQRGDLRHQVIEPTAGSRVGMRGGDGDVVLGVDGIFAAQSSEALHYAILDGRVAGLSVKHQIDPAIIGVVRIRDDKGAAIKALSQARSGLIQVGISSN